MGKNTHPYARKKKIGRIGLSNHKSSTTRRFTGLPVAGGLLAAPATYARARAAETLRFTEPSLRSCSHRRRCDATAATEARVAVGVIQRIDLQRGLAPGRSSRRALSVVALAATRQNH